MPKVRKEQQFQLSFAVDDDGENKIVCVKGKTEEAAFKAMIANNVKAARRYANMTQEELAEKLYGKNSKNRICEFESGQVTPNHLQLSKISKITGVSLDYIYGNSPEPLLDEYGAQLGLAMSLIQQAVKPTTQALALVIAKTVNKIPTSGTIVLLEKISEFKRRFHDIRDHIEFEEKNADSADFIRSADEVFSIAKKMEKEITIKNRFLERAATDAIIHDEKLESGHMLMADMFDPVHHVVKKG